MMRHFTKPDSNLSAGKQLRGAKASISEDAYFESGAPGRWKLSQ